MTDETAEYYGDEALDLTEDMDETWEIKIRGKEGEKKKKSRILRFFYFWRVAKERSETGWSCSPGSCFSDLSGREQPGAVHLDQTITLNLEP